MQTTAMQRSRMRQRRTKIPYGRWIAIIAAVLLIALGIYYIMNFPKDVQKISYPLLFETEIRREAGAFHLDPARVAAVIYCESTFRPDVVSSAGACGLMQIMPDTGRWLATKFEGLEYTDDMLFDPDTNIRLGCWYLNYLDERSGGDLTRATASYHAGQGTVDKWLQDDDISSDGTTLEAIPSAVTDTYVKRVLEAYEQYKELLPDESTTNQ